VIGGGTNSLQIARTWSLSMKLIQPLIRASRAHVTSSSATSFSARLQRLKSETYYCSRPPPTAGLKIASVRFCSYCEMILARWISRPFRNLGGRNWQSTLSNVAVPM
jgi:hypothetical protein